MAKIRDRELMPFQCSNCGQTLGWTAPGEAKRISVRAALYCEVCKDGPATLTPRQEEVIAVGAQLRFTTGRAPTLAEIGNAMEPPLSHSRVQSLTASIRLRGHEEALHNALYGTMGMAELPRPEKIADAPVEVHTPLDDLQAVSAAPSWADVGY